MKKILLSISMFCAVAVAFGQNNVTFQVDMNQYGGAFTTPEVNGDFNGWCGNCNALSDPDGDNIWDVTLPLTQDSIEFKFAHDSWTGQENLTPGSACTKTTGGFTNRFIYITGDTTLPVVCWESCIGCVPPPDTSMITFQVDMSRYTETFTTPEVNGTFNGWCGNCNPMSDPDGDNIWEVTLPIVDTQIEFKFAHDNWGGDEMLDESLPCVVTNGGFTNRFMPITGDTILPPVCWEYCITCDEIPDTNDVTFQVDMRGYDGTYTTPEVNGIFNGWCGNCNPLEDADGDSIWTTTIPIYQDSMEYKFSHDNWTGQEELTEGLACTKTTGDFTNRFIYINADTTLPAVCWESCDMCPMDSTAPAGIQTIDMAGLTIYPNPANEMIWVESTITDNMTVRMLNTSGQEVRTVLTNGEMRVNIDIADLPNGIYFVNFSTEELQVTKRFVKVK